MLTDPTGARTCYIGMSIDPVKRLAQHINDPTNRDMRLWIQCLRVRGLSPVLTILDRCNQSEAKIAEEDAIAIVRAVRGVDCLNRKNYTICRWKV